MECPGGIGKIGTAPKEKELAGVSYGPLEVFLRGLLTSRRSAWGATGCDPASCRWIPGTRRIDPEAF